MMASKLLGLALATLVLLHASASQLDYEISNKRREYVDQCQNAEEEQRESTVWERVWPFGSQVWPKQALDDWEYTVNLMKEVWNLFGGKSRPAAKLSDEEKQFKLNEPQIENFRAKVRELAAATPPAIPATCMNNGYVGSVTNSRVNKCVSQHCMITELICNGQYFTAWNVTGPLSACIVTKMACNETGIEQFTTPPRQNCVIDKFLCGSTVKSVNEVTDPTKCDAQIKCGNMIYGFQAFDFYCQSDKLTCNGAEIQNPTGVAVSNSCVVVSGPCDLGSSPSIPTNSSFTTKIDTTCVNTILDNICPTKIDHTVACATTNALFCSPKTIECGLATYDYSNYNGSLAFCQNLRSVECNGQVTELNRGGLGNTKLCRVSEINCNGTLQQFVVDIPKTCSISKVICTDFTNISACTSHLFGCTSPRCTYRATQSPVLANCSQPGQTVSCVCPYDFAGDRCSRHRTVDCNFTLVEPQPHCDPSTIDPFYLNDPVCYEYKVNDVVPISFTANCKFRGLENTKIDPANLGNFTYIVVTDYVAITKPLDSHAVLRIYNFNRLSQYMAISPLANFTKEVLSKESPMRFSLNMSTLIPNYAHGGRVYAELRIKHDWGYYSDVSGLKHRFVFDLTDWVDPIPRKSNTNAVVIALAIVIPVVALGVIGLVAFYCWRKREAEREEEEEEEEETEVARD